MQRMKRPWAWPSSRITRGMMRAMHNVRETATPRRPISLLVAEAVEAQYGTVKFSGTNDQPKEAA